MRGERKKRSGVTDNRRETGKKDAKADCRKRRGRQGGEGRITRIFAQETTVDHKQNRAARWATPRNGQNAKLHHDQRICKGRPKYKQSNMWLLFLHKKNGNQISLAP